MTTETALAVSKYFVDRHMNIEHCRYDVIGHIISQGFSSFGDNKMLKESELIGSQEPFNICLGSVVYKIVREYMAEVIEESGDKDSPYYGCVSTSWEIGFNEFDIALGSKRLADAEIISDPKRVAELTQYLKMEGGTGFMPNGTPVYCIIKGDARPLGCAFTGNPAAPVKGVFVPTSTENEEDPKNPDREHCCSTDPKVPEILPEKEEKASLEGENDNNLLNNIEINSQTTKNTVNKNMKLTSTEDITPEFMKQADASVVRDFISVELEKTSKTFSEQVAAAEKDKAAVEATLEATNKTLSEVQTKLDELNKQVEAKVKQEAFNSRMDEVSSTYELNDAQRAAVASQIKELDSDGYTAWKSNAELFMAKKVVASAKEETVVVEDEKEKEAAAALKNATASETPALTNSTSPESGSEISKLIGSLAGAISINKQ
jgi:hypothetical protein